MNDEPEPLELITSLGGSQQSESVYEREPPRRAKAAVLATVGLAVLLGVIVLGVVLTARNATTTAPEDEAEPASAEPADAAPAADDAATNDSDRRGASGRRSPSESRPDATAQPALTLAPPPSLPPLAGLPRRRPDAQLFAIDAGLREQLDSPNSSSNGAASSSSNDAIIFSKDLTDGSVLLHSTAGQPNDLLYLDGDLVVRAGRDVRLLGIETTDDLLLAQDTSSMLAAFNPPRVVVTFDERATTRLVRARVVGLDGLTVNEVIFPAEARVLGAIGEHFFVAMAGEIWAWTGTGEPTYLGAGRPIGIGASGVIAVRCGRDGCRLEVVGVDPDPPFDITAGRRIELPDRLSRAHPDHWSEPGVVSPNGRMLAFHLAQLSGNVRGVMVIDLVTGTHAFSPEQSVELGDIAWSSDSRYLLYAFDGDVMVWEPDFTSGMGPSGRVMINRRLESLVVT